MWLWRSWTAIAGLLLILAAFDLSSPAGRDLRSFQPSSVARLETEMWRAYYEQRHFPLFLTLAKTLRTQYGLSYLRSYRAAAHAAWAAQEFQRGRGQEEYARALPSLHAFYRLVLPEGRDVKRVAALELQWWIVHRQRDVEKLTHLLAELQASIYGLPTERFEEHARMRAEAMLLRDQRGAAINEADWLRIRTMLEQSWQSFYAAVRPDRQHRGRTLRAQCLPGSEPLGFPSKSNM